MDLDGGTVLFSPHLAWRNEPLRDNLQRLLRRPVLLTNDADAAAWAEWRFGAGQGQNRLVCITLGTGIGGAMVMDGRLERGRFGVAGEFGHQIIMPGGHRCECGNRGCWEQYASGNALGREARELAAANSPVAQELLKAVDGQRGAHHRSDCHRTGQGRGRRPPGSCSRTSGSGWDWASPTLPPRWIRASS